MEYRECKPEEIKAAKIKNLIHTIIATVPIIIGLIVAIPSLAIIANVDIPIKMSTVSYDEMSEDGVYYLEDLTVIKSYDPYKDSYRKSYLYDNYYIVTFTDKDDNQIFATLGLSVYDKIYDECSKAENEGYTAGDVVLKGSFKLASMNSTVGTAFFKEYSAVPESHNSKAVELILVNEGGPSYGGYIASEMAIGYFLLVPAVLLIAFGAIRIVYFVRLRKYLVEYLDAYNATSAQASN